MGSTENNPTQYYKRKCQQYLSALFPCRQQSSFRNLIRVFAVFAEEDEREEEEGVVCAPGNKSPVRTMPKAGEEEDGKRVADDNKFLVTVWILDIDRDFRTATAERDIHVIAESSSQRNMPSSPELRHVAREIGVVEVAH